MHTILFKIVNSHEILSGLKREFELCAAIKTILYHIHYWTYWKYVESSTGTIARITCIQCFDSLLWKRSLFDRFCLLISHVWEVDIENENKPYNSLLRSLFERYTGDPLIFLMFTVETTRFWWKCLISNEIVRFRWKSRKLSEMNNFFEKIRWKSQNFHKIRKKPSFACNFDGMTKFRMK